MSDPQSIVEKNLFDFIKTVDEGNRTAITCTLASACMFFMDAVIYKGCHDDFLEHFMENVGKLYIKNYEKKKTNVDYSILKGRDGYSPLYPPDASSFKKIEIMSDIRCIINEKIVDLIENTEGDDKPVIIFRLASTALFFMDTMIYEGCHESFLKDIMGNLGELCIKKHENHLKIVH